MISGSDRVGSNPTKVYRKNLMMGGVEFSLCSLVKPPFEKFLPPNNGKSPNGMALDLGSRTKASSTLVFPISVLVANDTDGHIDR